MAFTRVGPIQHIEFLFGKIESRFHQHAQLDQLLQQLFDCARELATQRAQRAACGAVCGGLDQVGHALGLGQVELVVEKRAAGEFAGLGRRAPSSRQPDSICITTGPPWPCSSSTSSPV